MLRRTPALAALGAALLGVATLALLAPGRSVAAGFAALFAVVIGFALLAPAVTVLAVRALEPVHARLPGCLGALAVRGVSASLSRTSIAIAALMVALSATVGVGIMVDSFRTSVERWLGMTLRADLYLGVPGADQALDPDLVNVARALPGVAHMSSGRRVRLQATSGELRTLVIEMAPGSYAGFELVDGEPATAWPAFDASDAVLVSEPFAWRHRLGRGDTLDVLTDDGPETFAIVGVYRDYESERGRVLMSRGTFARHWDDPRVSTLGLYLEEGAEPAQVAAAAEALFSARQAVVVRANGEIKAASMAIFERTFTITAVLRVLATVVAIVGVLSALMALELERAKEVAILRAQGLTRGGLWVLVEAQTGLMGLLSGVLAIPLGLALALILVHVINRRSFGWGMSLHVEPAILVQAPLIAVAAALLAGVYPAWRMAMTTPAAGLREE
jgi:putative ABC transport system permease protein